MTSNNSNVTWKTCQLQRILIQDQIAYNIQYFENVYLATMKIAVILERFKRRG